MMYANNLNVYVPWIAPPIATTCPASTNNLVLYVSQTSAVNLFGVAAPVTTSGHIYARNVTLIDERMSETRNANGHIRLNAGTYEFDDGSILTVEHNGVWILDETAKKKRYRGNRELDFNRFVNASDILEGFVTFCASLGVSEPDIYRLPLKLFIMYLIVEAAKKDQDDYLSNEQNLKKATAAHSRVADECCGYCGAVLDRARTSRRLFFCSGAHMDLFEAMPTPGASLVDPVPMPAS